MTNVGDSSNSPYHFTVIYRSDRLDHLASYTLRDVNLRLSFDVTPCLFSFMRKWVDGKMNGRIQAFNVIAVSGTYKTNAKAVQKDPSLGEDYYGKRFGEEIHAISLLEKSFRRQALDKDDAYD